MGCRRENEIWLYRCCWSRRRSTAASKIEHRRRIPFSPSFFNVSSILDSLPINKSSSLYHKLCKTSTRSGSSRYVISQTSSSSSSFSSLCLLTPTLLSLLSRSLTLTLSSLLLQSSIDSHFSSNRSAFHFCP